MEFAVVSKSAGKYFTYNSIAYVRDLSTHVIAGTMLLGSERIRSTTQAGRPLHEGLSDRTISYVVGVPGNAAVIRGRIEVYRQS
jgi:azurin